MNYPVTRMYASAKQAAEAVARLQQHGFTAEQINSVTPENAGSDAEAITAKIAAGNVLQATARLYAEGIKRGASLVSVQAPFGMGGDATAVLDGFGPIDSGVAEVRDLAAAWDDATPMSSALHLPVIVKGDPTFSGFFSVKVLSRSGATLCSLLGIPELSRGSRQSSTFGIGLLTSSAMSLSSKLGLPLLLGSSRR